MMSLQQVMAYFNTDKKLASQFLNIANKHQILHLEPEVALDYLAKYYAEDFALHILAEVLYDPTVPNNKMH